MKRLILLRHAKAAPKDQPDFDRRLTKRGREQAEAVAAFLAREGLRPDAALVSSSARTRETWALAGKELGEVPTQFDRRIYEGEAPDLLRAVRETDATVGVLMLVGHNPSVHELAVGLVREVPKALPADFPTAGVAVVDFDVESWKDVGPRTGRLALFADPEDMR